MSKELEELTQRIEGLTQIAFDNGVKTERLRVLNIIAEEAKASMAGMPKSDWIVALIKGDDE